MPLQPHLLKLKDSLKTPASKDPIFWKDPTFFNLLEIK